MSLPMLSIGQQLAHARTSRDLTIEDVAFHTHIPAGQLRDMESDDLSRFANLTYARSFLKLYSTFLELDISDYLDQFSSAELATASGHEYVQMARATHNLPAAVFSDYGRARRPGLYILLVLVIAGGGIVWWYNQATPADESRPGGESAEVSSTAESPLSPASAPATPIPRSEEVLPAKPVPEDITPSVTTHQDIPPPRPPDPTVKPPKATVVEEAEVPVPATPGTRPPN